MRDFALAPEFVELQAAAERLGRVELAPHVRDAERAGRWSDAVLAVLDGLPLGDLDLPERLGGVEAGSLAKVVTLETLAMPTPAVSWAPIVLVCRSARCSLVPARRSSARC